MQESNKKGIIQLKELKDSLIDHGTKAIILMGSGRTEPCTVSHITPYGEWSVETKDGNYLLSADDSLTILIIKDTLREITIAHKYWKKALNLIGKEVVYEIKPLKFKSGGFNNMCNLCTCYFLGTKGQPVCQQCSIEHGEAILDFKKVPKEKKPRLVQPAVVRKIAENAFIAGRLGEETFEEWYTKNY